MNRVSSTPVPPGDELDALLGAFFKAELPDPWPAFEPPTQRRILPLPRRQSAPAPFRLRSRLALAASLALIFVAGWLLAGRFPALPQSVLPAITGGDATNRPLPPVAPDSRSDPEEKDDAKGLPGKAKSSVSLEQGNEGTGIKIIVEPPPSGQ